MKWRILPLLLALAFLTACGAAETPKGDAMPDNAYRQITQQEAAELMAGEGYILLDVRRPDEFASGHIPGAINIPNETIGDQPPEELGDLTQLILVYCRSGNRSKEAAQKLAAMGYANVAEFGGIIDWTGPVVSEASAPEGNP